MDEAPIFQKLAHFEDQLQQVISTLNILCSRLDQLHEKKEPVWLDKQEVMQMFHISSRTLCRWRREQSLSHSRLKGKIYYKLDDLQHFLSSRRQE